MDVNTGELFLYYHKMGISISVNKEETWVSPDTESDALLGHMQGVFDIYKIFAWRLGPAVDGRRVEGGGVSDLDGYMSGNLVEAKTVGLKEANRGAAEVIDQYNRETEFGANSASEAEWRARIDRWMADPQAIDPRDDLSREREGK
jgi:hypothetical protein